MATFDSTGFTPDTLSSVLADLLTQYQAIFGLETNFDSNTPQGQFFNILAQAKMDIEDLLQSVYSQRDPDQAIGEGLDTVCGYNGIFRQNATYTQQNVQITTDRQVTLQGLDLSPNNPYTVQDVSGNQFQLLTTTTLQSGTTTLLFQAANLGQIATVPNTITNPVTVILGVTNVNNTDGALTVGIDEETDSQFRIRRAKSVAIASSSFVDSIYSNLANVTGVMDLKVYSNNTNIDDTVREIPAHNLWCIVDGGSVADITNVIYKLKPTGTPMKGSVSNVFTTKSGERQVIFFDRPMQQNFYLQFNVKATQSGVNFDINAIKTYITANLKVSISDSIYDSDMVLLALAAVNFTGGDGKITNLQVSLDGTNWQQSIDPIGLGSKFTISASNIIVTVS